MLESIFTILEKVKGETENIRIAQGKYYLPKNIKGAFNQIKTEIRWRKQG
jgi:hypothetical protein